MAKRSKIVLGLLSILMTLCLTMAIVPNALKASAAEAEPDFYINFTDVKDVSKIDDTVELVDGKFILSGSDVSYMSIDNHSKAANDGKTFSKRLKMEGVNNGMYRTISFYLEKKADVTVYAYSASSSDSTRKLSLYQNGKSTAVAESPELNGDGDIRPFTWKTEEAGSYYIAQAQTGGVNVYYISVTYTGEATPVQRNDWAEVAAPVIGAPVVSDDGVSINVPFTGVVGDNGADYALVNMYKEGDETPIATRRYLPYGDNGSVSFKPANSGKYTFKVELYRKGETNKASETASVDFTYNLYVPTLRAKTVELADKSLTLEVTITQVNEADYYSLYWKEKDSKDVLGNQDLNADPTKEEITYIIPGLEKGKEYTLFVTATRNSTQEITKDFNINAIVRNGEERDWQFRYFGTSTKENLNYMSSVDAKPNIDDDGGNIYDGLKLTSCSYNPDTDVIGSQGGKFTYGFFDGISYYFTPIKAAEEDFRLRSKITVEYINAAGNGQEGFALLVRDAIGENGSTDPFYSNSVAAISTKIQQKVGMSNLTVKPGIGARFVTGLTKTTGVDGDTPVQKMYFFDRSAKAAKGLNFTFEVEKKNNTYYARYYSAKGELISEKTLFHTETVDDGDPSNDTLYDPLCQIDKENVYVGFAAARGCVVNFTDIDFQVTPRSTDYIEIIPEPITATSSIASPTTSSLPQYNFKFYANSDGVVDVYLNDMDGTKDEKYRVISGQEIKADVYFEQVINLTEVDNRFDAYFTPKEGFKTQYGEALDFYDEQTSEKLVTYKNYGEANQALIVAPEELENSPTGVIGTAKGTGALNDPLDLQTALNYVLPGQTIYMIEGTYVNTKSNYTIEKGNDGEPGKLKVLRAHPQNKTRPVLDFKQAGGGFTLWGNYWHLNGFDITRTADAKKGLQVGAKYCVIEDINAYNNGDTGIQISGKSTDLPQFWPSNNLILNCTSYMNADRAHEDADGFAAKLYCGGNNIFKGCLSYCNADDGWDLYAKTESGSIGQVIIEDCITFGNGFFIDGTESKGNGNGFKLGGENLTGHHVIRNSISFGNKMKGIDSNSCPDIEVYGCTSIYNSKYNYAFYTALGVNPKTSFKAKNNISLLGLSSDNISNVQNEGEEYVLFSDNNYFFYNDNSFSLNGKNMPKGTYNVSGATLDYTKLHGWTKTDTTPNDEYDDDVYAYFGFELDGSGAKGTIKRGNFKKVISYISRAEDGSLVVKDNMFTLDNAPEGLGTVIKHTPGSHVANFTPEFKDDEGNTVSVVFGQDFNKELTYIEPTDGKDNPDFNYEEKPDDSSSSSISSSSSSSTTNNNGNQGNLTWLFIVLGVVVVLGAGAAVYFLVIKKKKQ